MLFNLIKNRQIRNTVKTRYKIISKINDNWRAIFLIKKKRLPRLQKEPKRKKCTKDINLPLNKEIITSHNYMKKIHPVPTKAWEDCRFWDFFFYVGDGVISR